MEKTKEQIVDDLKRKSTEEIDVLRDAEIVRLGNLEKKYYIYKDDHIVLTRKLDKEMREEGVRETQIKRDIQRNEEVYKLKRLINEYSYLIKDSKNMIKLLTSAFWRSKV